jgi:putative addiction module component (TIGR02574 family)
VPHPRASFLAQGWETTNLNLPFYPPHKWKDGPALPEVPHPISRYNSVMSPNAQRLLDEARQLPPVEREWLAECLLIDDESVSAAEVESAWDAEIKRRLDEIDSGAVKMIPHEEVLADMDAHIAAKRRG